MKKSLNGSTYLDIGALIKTNMKFLDSMVNRKLNNNLSIAGKINELKLIGLLPQRNELRVQIQAKAKCALISNGNF
jgi:hypothetical protein